MLSLSLSVLNAACLWLRVTSVYHITIISMIYSMSQMQRDSTGSLCIKSALHLGLIICDDCGVSVKIATVLTLAPHPGLRIDDKGVVSLGNCLIIIFVPFTINKNGTYAK